jgi:hypothetical protein
MEKTELVYFLECLYSTVLGENIVSKRNKID